MTSIRWGINQEGHEFNTISHSIDENEGAGSGVLKRNPTQVFIQPIGMRQFLIMHNDTESFP